MCHGRIAHEEQFLRNNVIAAITSDQDIVERFAESVGTGINVKALGILAATAEDLEQAIRERSFREDLYYRLNGRA